MAASSSRVDWPARRPRYTIVQVSDPHVPADGFLFDRGSDVRLVLSGHTHRVSAGTLAGVPAWVSPSTGSHADVLSRHGFRGHAGGGFTRVDILGDGEIVATFVPLTGRERSSTRSVWTNRSYGRRFESPG